MRKYFFIFLLFLSFVPCAFAVGCVSDYDLEINANAPIMIGETEYYSLAEAIAKADDGDAILVFDDVAESRDNEYVKPLTSAVVADDVYVAYEINKPLVIKGVGNGSKQPKIYGSFLINLSDQNYLENSITIDNLEIVHGYMSIDNNVVNEKFAVGVRVFDGSANVVNNYMHTISHVDDEQIQKNNLPLTYGLMLSRPLESDMMGGVLRYDITGNRFGEYHNNKDYAFSSPVAIIEMHEDLGNFAPAILNTKSNNFATELFNENKFDENNIVYALHYIGEDLKYQSLAVKEEFDVDFSKFEREKCSFIFDGDFLKDDIISVDVYGVLVFTGDVQNVIFNLKDKNAKVVIEGEKLGQTVINEFDDKNAE